MPIGSKTKDFSRFDKYTLPKTMVAPEPHTHKKEWWQKSSFWSWITIGVEIGATIALEVATAGGATPIAAADAVAIATEASAETATEAAETVVANVAEHEAQMAAKAARAVLRNKQRMIGGLVLGTVGASSRVSLEAGLDHNVNLVGTAIDFAAAVTPFVGAGVNNLRLGARQIKRVEDIEGKISAGMTKLNRKQGVKLTRNLSRVERSRKMLGKSLEKRAKGFERINAKEERIQNLYKKRRSLLKIRNRTDAQQLKIGKMKEQIGRYELAQSSAVDSIIRAEKMGKKWGTVLSTSMSKTKAYETAFEETNEIVKYGQMKGLIDKGFFRKASVNSFRLRSTFRNEKFDYITRKLIQDVLLSDKQLVKYAGVRGAMKKVKEIAEALDPAQRDIYLALNRRMLTRGVKKGAGLFKNGENKELSELFTGFYKSLSVEQRHLVGNTLSEARTLFFKSAGQKSVKRDFKYITTRIGSRGFNDKIVQRMQLIDPNDLGRAPSERIYQYIKNRYTNWLNNDVQEIMEKRADKKFIKRAKDKMVEGGRTVRKKYKSGKPYLTKVERVFQRSGGNLIPRNRYLLGYKLIPTPYDMGKLNHMAMFVFNKITTASETGKNVGGKKDELVKLSDKDIIGLETYGVEYYWSEGKKKGWYVNRGGRKKDANINPMTTELTSAASLFLGFIPIPALRNLLSITSNYVENIYALSTGSYFKSYSHKLVRSLERSGINRTARILSRVIIGESLRIGVAKTASSRALKYAAKESGRELQRFSTLTLSLYEKPAAHGGYGISFKKPSGKSTYWTKYRSGVLTLGKSRMLKTKIGGQRTASRKKFGTTRKYGQVRRVASAVTPNKTFNSRSFGRLKW